MDPNNTMTPQELAASLLKSVNKSVNTAVQFDEVPEELCWGEEIRLDQWSMVTTDNNLVEMSKMPRDAFLPDASKKKVPDMFDRFFLEEPSFMPHGLVSLSMKNAKGITDYGLSILLRRSPKLRHLDLTGCIAIGDVCMRELGMHCQELQSLILTSCHSIVGEGLVSVGDMCKQIRKLSISRCKNLEKFAVTKLFVSCSKLEELDVSYYLTITDDEVRLLAQSCPHMMIFNAKESHFLSDQSILALSRHCPDLDKIDMSRENYSYKISDVGLLSLGQRSSSLRSLVLNGCDHVSDVGINWLAEGCNALEQLELCGCTKLTDAGLRSISHNCHSLNKLDISHAQLVSDVGVASIASGCPDLKTFKCHGLFYLSDPRIEPPKKKDENKRMSNLTKPKGSTSGMKDDKLDDIAWQVVVGMAAIAKNAPNLECVDFSGCFRLNKSLKTSLSQMKHLLKLNLMGCTQATDVSLAGVAIGCTLLEELCLSDCVKGVTGVSMDAFGTYCLNLRVIVLARCHNLDGRGISGIAKCAKLEKLDLNSCTNLTDMRLLPISEVDKVKDLRHLIINNIPKLTDTTLSWVANGCYNLSIFSFKGTAITKPGTKAVRDKFPYSEMIFNDNFCGYWPIPRIDDIKLLNHYYVMRKGIVAMQGRARKLVAYKVAAGYAEKLRRERAAWKVLSCVRIYIAKKRAKYRRWRRDSLHRAASKIVTVFLIAKAKARVKREINRQILKWKSDQAHKIQRCFMAHYVWVRQLLDAREYFRYLRKRFYAVRKIQSIIRMQFKGIRVVKKKWEMIYATRELWERKSEFLQRVYRGYQGRCYVHVLRARRKRAKERYLSSVSIVQKNYRHHRTHLIVKKGNEKRRTTKSAVIKIQSLIRGFLDRLLVFEIKADMQEEKEDRAIRKIQAVWKAALVKLDVAALEAGLRALDDKRWHAQIVFAKHYRRKLAYRIYVELKQKKVDAIHLRAEALLGSAVKIQALYRGKKGRERYMIRLRAKRGKWKELFDEGKQKRFFYSKLTGEIRWRMPRDLLELLPRPSCDNCSFYEASIECAVCNEMFCSQCWDSVHYGGRRKDHEWRSLYDFYGKRIDYGDGGFPCKWPTEVIQDEVQGWMLRVAPIRDPNTRYGDWEEYEDIPGKIEGSQMLKERSNQGISAGDSRLFYFNRRTFEATYEEPSEVSEIKESYSRPTTYGTAYSYTSSQEGYDSRPYTGYEGHDSRPYTGYEGYDSRPHTGYDSYGTPYAGQTENQESRPYTDYSYSDGNNNGTANSAYSGSISRGASFNQRPLTGVSPDVSRPFTSHSNAASSPMNRTASRQNMHATFSFSGTDYTFASTPSSSRPHTGAYDDARPFTGYHDAKGNWINEIPFSEGFYDDGNGNVASYTDNYDNGTQQQVEFTEDPEIQFKLQKSYEKLDKPPIVTPRSPSVAYKEQSKRLAERKKSKTAGGGLRGTRQIDHNVKSRASSFSKSSSGVTMGSRSNANTPNTGTPSSSSLKR